MANENGFVMATVILLLLVLGTLIFTSTQWSATDIKRTANYTKTRDAFYVAEAGLQRAFNFMNYDDTGICPGAAGDGMDAEIDGSNWPSAIFTDFDYNDGQYTVTAVDNNDDGNQNTDLDNTIVLTSTGIKKNVTATIEAVVFRPLFESDGALVTNGELIANGGFDIYGTNGTAHSNTDFDQAGGSGSDTFSSSTGPCSGDTCTNTGGGESKAMKPLPKITDAEIQAFKNKSNVVLRADGKIEVHDLSLDPTDGNFSTILKKQAGCWKTDGETGGQCASPGDLWYDEDQLYGSIMKTGSTWSVTGLYVPDNAMLYVEGDIGVTGSPDPWTVSIVSEGYINLVGGTTISNYRDPNMDPATQDMFFLAGTDFQMAGGVNLGVTGSLEQGWIAVRDQMDVGGNVFLRGWMIATDISTAENLVSGENKLHGGIEIEYNGDMQAPFLGCKLNVLSWKEMGSGVM